MRKNLLGIVAAFLAGAGLAQAQENVNSGSPAARALVPSAPGVASAYPYYAGGPSSVPAEVVAAADGTTAPMATAPCVTCQDECHWKVHGWLGADYLLRFLPAQNLPNPLVTTGIRAAATVVGGQVGYSPASGFGIDAGLWLDSEKSRGAQTIVNQTIRIYNTIAPGANVAVGLQTTTAAGVANAPIAATNFNFTTWSQYSNAEANSLFRLGCGECTKIYALAGTRVSNLEEDISMTYTAGGGNFLDEFHTRSIFGGGQVGVLVKHQQGRLGFDLAAKVALGLNYNNIIVLGRNDLGAGVQAYTGPSNIGYFESSDFSVIPEVQANVSYNLTQRIRLRVGYDFTCWTRVVRPGDQITAIFPPVGPASTMPFTRTTFLMHGLNAGASFKY